MRQSINKIHRWDQFSSFRRQTHGGWLFPPPKQITRSDYHLQVYCFQHAHPPINEKLRKLRRPISIWCNRPWRRAVRNLPNGFFNKHSPRSSIIRLHVNGSNIQITYTRTHTHTRTFRIIGSEYCITLIWILGPKCTIKNNHRAIAH